MRAAGLLLCLLAVASASEHLVPGFRLPAVPLIVMDPYMHIWSPANQLFDTWPVLWDGATKALAGMIRVDGHSYRFLGTPGGDPVKQTSVKVLPTTTVYTFTAGDVELTVRFVTPAVPQDIKLLSQPVTYVLFDVKSTDGKTHKVDLYFDAAGEICVHDPATKIVWNRGNDTGIEWMRFGSKDQKQFSPVGDRVGINWGYAYISVPSDSQAKTSIGADANNRGTFLKSGTLPTKDDTRQPRAASDAWPVMSVSWSFNATATPVSKHLTFAYDDINSIKWFGTSFPPLWKKYFRNARSLLVTAEADFNHRINVTERLDQAVIEQTFKAGGSKYATVAAAVWRQTFGGHKLVWNTQKNTTWYFLKEISSNGDFSTVDVLYPAIPLLLWANPVLAELILLPHLSYAAGEAPIKYDLPWAPHQLGVWPVADATPGSQEQMPVEETANLLLIAEWLAKYGGKDYTSKLYPAYKSTFDLWAQYLTGLPLSGEIDHGVDRLGADLGAPIEAKSSQDCRSKCLAEPKCQTWAFDICGSHCWLKGKTSNTISDGCRASGLKVPVKSVLQAVLPDPGNQLCTDDFLGPIDHNVNLAAKGIIAVDGYGLFLSSVGRNNEAQHYHDVAKSFSQWWQTHGIDKDHYKLQFDQANTYSIQYNLVFQKFLNISTFPRDILDKEAKYYLNNHWNTFGAPLNSNAAKDQRAFTKLDWLSWAGAMSASPSTAEKYWEAAYNTADKTANRVPLTDWYDTKTGNQVGFQARPVMGGFYAYMLVQQENKLKFKL